MVQRGSSDHVATRVLSVLIACVCLIARAHAEVRWHASVGITSDYMQAGLSQTRGDAALQGGVRADLERGWSIGVWSSQIDRNPGPGATYEIQGFVARAWQLSPEWVATLTATHYAYPNDTPYLRYDYDEVAASVGYRSRVFATVAWSPNISDAGNTWYARRRETWAYELALTQPLHRAWSANAGVGRRDMSALFGSAYWYGHAGVSYTAGAMTCHLTYVLTDGTARHYFGAERADDTLVGSIIWRIGATH